MARILMCGFEAGHRDVAYSNQNKISSAKARTGNYSIYLGTNLSGAYWWFFQPRDEIYLRLGYLPTGTYNTGSFASFADDAGGAQITLVLNNATREISVRRGSHNGAVLASGGQVPPNDTAWVCLELHLKIHSTAGKATLKMDGAVIIDFDGNTQATGQANVARFQVGESLTGGLNIGMGYFDDIAINDTAGARNNSWIGRGGIYGVKPNNAGAYAQFTPSAGANYECVDEVPPDDDTSYVESDTVGHKDSYALGDLPVSVGQVQAVQWIARAKLDAAGEGNFKRLLRHGATDYAGSDLAVDASYRYFQEIFDAAPDNTDWTIAKVNALEAGMEVS